MWNSDPGHPLTLVASHGARVRVSTGRRTTGSWQPAGIADAAGGTASASSSASTPRKRHKTDRSQRSQTRGTDWYQTAFTWSRLGEPSLRSSPPRTYALRVDRQSAAMPRFLAIPNGFHCQAVPLSVIQCRAGSASPSASSSTSIRAKTYALPLRQAVSRRPDVAGVMSMWNSMPKPRASRSRVLNVGS